MKTVFTTGEAAKICKVSQQTIIRCFDSGQLKGFRVPGSKFRRIPRELLYKFMKENNIPTDALESGKRKALIVDDDPELVELIRDVLEADGRFEVRVANNGSPASSACASARYAWASCHRGNGACSASGSASDGHPTARSTNGPDQLMRCNSSVSRTILRARCAARLATSLA